MPGDLGAGSLEALPLDALVGDLGDDFLPGGADAMRWGADAMFAAAPEARALALHRDVAGICAHVLHPGNRSRETEVAACGAVD